MRERSKSITEFSLKNGLVGIIGPIRSIIPPLFNCGLMTELCCLYIKNEYNIMYKFHPNSPSTKRCVSDSLSPTTSEAAENGRDNLVCRSEEQCHCLVGTSYVSVRSYGIYLH